MKAFRVINFFYDFEDIIGEYNSDWSGRQRSFTHGPGVDEILGMTDYTGESPADYFFHHDGMGSIVGITDVNETLKTSYLYGPFGDFMTTYHDGTIDSPFTYTGREYSSATGLFHYRARDYMPGIGRFMSRDPYPYSPGNPASIQRYNYVQNSPVNYTDPFGLQFDLPGMNFNETTENANLVDPFLAPADPEEEGDKPPDDPYGDKEWKWGGSPYPIYIAFGMTQKEWEAFMLCCGGIIVIAIGTHTANPWVTSAGAAAASKGFWDLVDEKREK
jgi:RHS repeat-associated protein